jgi:hypothetical protein
MRNSFWQEAANSLPAPVRARYAGYFETAERWDETLDALLEAGERAKKTIGRLCHPKATPQTHP